MLDGVELSSTLDDLWVESLTCCMFGTYSSLNFPSTGISIIFGPRSELSRALFADIVSLRADSRGAVPNKRFLFHLLQFPLLKCGIEGDIAYTGESCLVRFRIAGHYTICNSKAHSQCDRN